MLDDAHVARVGPNALIQMEAALRALAGDDAVDRVFAEAGLSRDMPRDMVPETSVRALFDALPAVRPDDWRAIMAEAGTRTADYILANRIPSVAKLVLRALPHALAAPLLARAIARHAWTFCGSGAFDVGSGRPLTLTIAPNTIAQPGCPWHCAVFERLFRSLASADSRVEHSACCALGATSCVFGIRRGPIL